MNNIKIPERVVICGIGYRVTEIEGMIIFSEDGGFYGCCDRMSFYRPEFASWQIELITTFGHMMVSHISEAFELVKEWRGDDFGREYHKK